MTIDYSGCTGGCMSRGCWRAPCRAARPRRAARSRSATSSPGGGSAWPPCWARTGPAPPAVSYNLPSRPSIGD